MEKLINKIESIRVFTTLKETMKILIEIHIE
jgi:hypothetical protein